MKRLDTLILGILHRISERSYRRFSFDNYALGTVFIILAVALNIGIAIVTFDETKSGVNFPLTPVRGSVSIFAATLLGGISVAVLICRKTLRNWFQLRYDLGQFENRKTLVIALRWITIGIYPTSVFLGDAWWGMLDVLFLGIGMMFLGCPPPDMNLRLRKALSK